MRGFGLASWGKLEKSNQSAIFRNVEGEAIFAGGRCQNLRLLVKSLVPIIRLSDAIQQGADCHEQRQELAPTGRRGASSTIRAKVRVTVVSAALGQNATVPSIRL